MTRFDLTLLVRTLGLSAVTTALAVLVVIATDESFSTLGMRAARLAAFSPGLSAVAAAVVMAQVESRGEARALMALGAPFWRVVQGVRLAGWLWGAVALVVVLSPLSDPSALFPAVTPAAWRVHGSGLVESQSGVFVNALGELGFGALQGMASPSYLPSRAAAALAIVPLSAVVPVWMTVVRSLSARLLGGAVVVLVTVVLLHGVAARQWSTLLLLGTGMPLLLQIVGRSRPEAGRA